MSSGLTSLGLFSIGASADAYRGYWRKESGPLETVEQPAHPELAVCKPQLSRGLAAPKPWLCAGSAIENWHPLGQIP